MMKQPMRYLSTRGQVGVSDFESVVMRGLAADGGLYVPETLPRLRTPMSQWSEQSFVDWMIEIVGLYSSQTLDKEELERLVRSSYAEFSHAEVTPLVQVGPMWVCELFHGPTLAFKDIAMQLLGRLFEYFLRRREQHMTIVAATSGDTGAAAAEALRGRAGVETFVFYPKGRIAPLVEQQITSVADSNVHAVAVEGSFDDCQALVKGLFAQETFRDEFQLAAVNSINWARVMAQIPYFFYAYGQLVAQKVVQAGQPVCFCIPSGNFGHAYAGLLAWRMGLPISKLLVATNRNRVLYHAIQQGRLSQGIVQQTLSPSMDIQISSNFERYLFDLSKRNSNQLRQWMQQLESGAKVELPSECKEQLRTQLLAESVDDDTTLKVIASVQQRYQYLLDPHSAVGWQVAEANFQNPTVLMSHRASRMLFIE